MILVYGSGISIHLESFTNYFPVLILFYGLILDHVCRINSLFNIQRFLCSVPLKLRTLAQNGKICKFWSVHQNRSQVDGVLRVRPEIFLL